MSGSEPVGVLLVEDDETLREVLARELAEVGFEVRALGAAEGAVAEARELQPQVALVDLKLPGAKGGMELVRELGALRPDLQVVVLTGHGGVPEAVEAMRRGAFDFLTKPTPLEVLERTLRRAAERSDLLRENRRLRRAASARDDPHRLLGESRAMEEVRRLVSRIAPSEASVLISGENGTGKELVARNLHRGSPRADRPWGVLNCGAVPAELVESELFGHERGAFTGADRRRVGLFEAADGGTLFLDEVAELPAQVQPALLRALQFGEVRRVGSDRTLRVDVRVVAATNRELGREIAEGRFREDLFYRLATFQIELPPLRARPEDVAPLARLFLARAAEKTGRPLAFSEDALERLAAHDWPGNVRELENAVTRISVLAGGETITAEVVEECAFGPRVAGRPGLPTLRLAELERIAVETALERCGGSKPRAAEELGIAVRTLYYKLEEYAAEAGSGSAGGA